jgi:predicted DNA-binding transcriptional regulator AlpA
MTDDPWISYLDLERHGFVNPSTGRAYSRKHLADMMRKGRWPKARQVSVNRIAWPLSELTARYQALPIARSLQSADGDAAPRVGFKRRAPEPADA